MKSAIECQRPSWSIPTTTVPFVIGLIALGCAAGEAPVESSEDAGLRELPSMTPISPANGTNLNGANSNTTPATMADQSGGSADSLGVDCEFGDPLGPCSRCGANGQAILPESDPTCPQVMCPGTQTYRKEESDGQIRCLRSGPPQGVQSRCMDIGVCPTALTACDIEEDIVGNPIELGGCQTMTGCEGERPPTLSGKPVGVSCRSGDTPLVRYVRLETREGDDGIRWSDIQILGQLGDDPNANLSILDTVTVEVSDSASVRQKLVDGDESTTWGTNEVTGLITINLGDEYPVRQVRIVAAKPYGDDTAHALYLADATKQWRLAQVFRGPIEDGAQLLFGGIGFCDANQVCQASPDCEQFVPDGGGKVCDFGGDSQNAYCEIFVERSTDNASEQRSCEEVCGPNSRCVGVYENATTQFSCRIKSGGEALRCDTAMRDFICRCAINE